MKFYVTRHGQTAWNRENLVCGITDLPLDETGREQARQTAALCGWSFQLIMRISPAKPDNTAD